MSEEQTSATTTVETGKESYVISDTQAQVDYVQGRRAARWLPFLLPHLKPGMNLLDCGCGVGSITLDLAEIVAPGATRGIDIDPQQLDIARASAAQRQLGNTQFATGSVYALPFADASFDVAVAHTVLFHLNDPLRALKEMRRVLKPGGMVAVADDDYSTWVISPEDSAMHWVMVELAPRIIIAHGGSPYYSRHLRRLLLEAGFARTEGHAVAAEYYGTLEETRRFAALSERVLRKQTQFTAEQGLASVEEIGAARAGVLAWGERPDAYAALLYCAALGWVAEETGA